MGTQLWAMTYQMGLRHRFTSIETYTFSGTTNYFVVGSVEIGGNDHLLAACINDNGNVIRSTELPASMFNNLIGLKGIPTSDGGFAIAGIESQNYTKAGPNAIVALKMDSLLNVQNYHVYESNAGFEDHDFATDIVEGATPDDYMIVGSANKDYSGMYDVPCAMSALIHMPTGMVQWSHNFSTGNTGHWDSGADGYYDAATNSYWVMANSSVRHYFNLTNIDATGTPLTFQQYNGALFSDYDVYGYEFRPSLSTPGNFVVGAWKFAFSTGSGQAVNPVLAEVDPVAYTVSWSERYTAGGSTDNNRMNGYSENALLAPRAMFQFPYFYHKLLTNKSNNSGYTIMDSDTLGMMYESPRLWYSNDLMGRVSCGSINPATGPDSWSSFTNSPIMHRGSFMPTGFITMTRTPIMHETVSCFGAARQEEATSVAAIVNEGGLSIYPNPASDNITIESLTGLRKISVTDIYGREVARINAAGSNKQTINTSGFVPGVYMVRLEDSNNVITTKTVQVIR